MAVNVVTISFWDCHRTIEEFTNCAFLSYLSGSKFEKAKNKLDLARAAYMAAKQAVTNGLSRDELRAHKSERKSLKNNWKKKKAKYVDAEKEEKLKDSLAKEKKKAAKRAVKAYIHVKVGRVYVHRSPFNSVRADSFSLLH